MAMENLAFDIQTNRESRIRLGGIQDENVVGDEGQPEDDEVANDGRECREGVEVHGLCRLRKKCSRHDGVAVNFTMEETSWWRTTNVSGSICGAGRGRTGHTRWKGNRFGMMGS